MKKSTRCFVLGVVGGIAGWLFVSGIIRLNNAYEERQQRIAARDQAAENWNYFISNISPGVWEISSRGIHLPDDIIQYDSHIMYDYCKHFGIGSREFKHIKDSTFAIIGVATPEKK